MLNRLKQLQCSQLDAYGGQAGTTAKLFRRLCVGWGAVLTSIGLLGKEGKKEAASSRYLLR